MGAKINYEQIMNEMIAAADASGRIRRLALHSCCGPCSTYCIERLCEHFSVTVFYYNPNIYPAEEYRMRADEQRRFLCEYPAANPVSFAEGPYDAAQFYAMAKGMEHLAEGGARCFACYELRLRETARYAGENGFDYFTTTLSVSPLKNAQKLNEIGSRLEEEYGVRYLHSDFKKKDGYKKSAEIAREYGMYRQYYCGCEFSKRDRDAKIAKRQKDEGKRG